MVGYAFHYKTMKKKKSDQWLDVLLKKKFFGVCEEHKDLRKSEINIYCVDCDHSMCPHCFSASNSAHSCHRWLQIRRYVYQDVVRISDMQKLMDCSKIQPYIVNSAKIVLLNSKKNPRPGKAPISPVLCKVCGCGISKPNRFCSIACKVSEESSETVEAAPFPSHESGPFISSLSPDLEDLSSPKEGESSPSHSSSVPLSDASEENIIDDNLEVAPKRRKINRRKGVPRRSPIL